ncbi:hypothetical protein Q787_05545 [Ornithobacterium rhinotracheale H06-030791]|nr:hypothetical protein Q785_05660 [Ornithobacterium rhinotracheale ORT-UMN 88]KGB67476.1 hypothetical protein Q787_05545 [Ornithobacterium rhinotracheale H06-030791]
MRKITIILVFLLSVKLFSQEVCGTPHNLIDDYEYHEMFAKSAKASCPLQITLFSESI